MKVLHLIDGQSDAGPGLRNLPRSPAEQDIWHSGCGDIPLPGAETLIGGMPFPHEAKARLSRFGGRVPPVEPVERSELQRSRRVVLEVQALAEGRGVRWRGACPAMASNGSIVDV